MSSVSSTPLDGAMETGQRVSDTLATACIALDRQIQSANEMQVAWARLHDDLAEAQVVLALAMPGYRAPAKVREALGGNFADGAMLEAGRRLGVIEYDVEAMVYYDAGSDPRTSERVARITESVRGE